MASNPEYWRGPTAGRLLSYTVFLLAAHRWPQQARLPVSAQEQPLGIPKCFTFLASNSSLGDSYDRCDNFPRKSPLAVEEHPSGSPWLSLIAGKTWSRAGTRESGKPSEAQRGSISSQGNSGGDWWGRVVQPAASPFRCQAGGVELFCSLTRVGPR